MSAGLIIFLSPLEYHRKDIHFMILEPNSVERVPSVIMPIYLNSAIPLSR